jgi:hypothetical protein
MFSALACAKPLLRCESCHSDVNTVSPGNPVQMSFEQASFPVKHLWVQFNDIQIPVCIASVDRPRRLKYLMARSTCSKSGELG